MSRPGMSARLMTIHSIAKRASAHIITAALDCPEATKTHNPEGYTLSLENALRLTRTKLNKIAELADEISTDA